MKNLNENELFERLRCPWKDQKITHEQITSPDYEVWGRAREWEYHQAVCLFSGMVPLSKPYVEGVKRLPQAITRGNSHV